MTTLKSDIHKSDTTISHEKGNQKDNRTTSDSRNDNIATNLSSFTINKAPNKESAPTKTNKQKASPKPSDSPVAITIEEINARAANYLRCITTIETIYNIHKF